MDLKVRKLGDLKELKINSEHEDEPEITADVSKLIKNKRISSTGAGPTYIGPNHTFQVPLTPPFRYTLPLPLPPRLVPIDSRHVLVSTASSPDGINDLDYLCKRCINCYQGVLS